MYRQRIFWLLISMVVTFVITRAFLYFSPNTDLNLGAYNIHHLYTGLILIVLGGIPQVLFPGESKRMLFAVIVFGCGLALALDEWVYLIVTPGTNSDYWLPVSFWGGVVALVIAIVYILMLVLFKVRDKR